MLYIFQFKDFGHALYFKNTYVIYLVFNWVLHCALIMWPISGQSLVVSYNRRSMSLRWRHATIKDSSAWNALALPPVPVCYLSHAVCQIKPEPLLKLDSIPYSSDNHYWSGWLSPSFSCDATKKQPSRNFRKWTTWGLIFPGILFYFRGNDFE